MPTEPPIQAPPDFLESAAALGVEFDEGDVERLARFLDLLLKANETTNLTAITDPAEAWRKHILDAMSLVPVLSSLEPAAPGDHVSIADIGSGGGVPAIPLAIVLPDHRFTLIEATGKKARFLEETAAALALTNIRVLTDRAERIGQMREHRERYTAAIARALGHLAIVAEFAAPLVAPGGAVVAVKGARADQELDEAAKALGLLGLRHVETLDTPTGRLVVLEKATRTPRTYPRRVGEPARVPLGIPRK